MFPPFAVIFDMDGVLVQSSDAVFQSFQSVLSQSGISLPDSEQPSATLPLRDQLTRWHDQFGVSFDYSDFNQKALSTELDILKNIRLDSSLLWLLRDLSSNNIPLAIATSSSRERAEKLLSILGIRAFFLAVLTSEDAPTKKELFQKISSCLGLPPNQCIVIAAAANIESARALGMKTIGFLSPPFQKSDLQSAHSIVESFSTLSTQSLGELVSPAAPPKVQ